MIRRQDGFTLVEMIVVSAIVTIVFLALFLLWDAGWSTLETAQAQAIVNQELRKGVDCLVSEVTEAGVSTINVLRLCSTAFSILTRLAMPGLKSRKSIQTRRPASSRRGNNQFRTHPLSQWL